MTQLNRRQLLRTTGAGAGIALGASAVTARETDVTGTAATTFTATATAGRIGLDIDSPDEAITFTAADIPDEEVVAQFDGVVHPTGSWGADEMVLPDFSNVFRALDLQQELTNFLETLDLDAVVDQFELDDVLGAIAGFLDDLDIDPETVESLRSTLDEILDDVVGPIFDIEDIESILFEGLDDFLDVDPETYTLTDLLTDPEPDAFRVLIANVTELLDTFDDFLGASVSPSEDEVPDLPGPEDLTLDDIIELVLDLADYEDLDELGDELLDFVDDLEDEDIEMVLGLLDIELSPGPVGGAFDTRESVRADEGASEADVVVTAPVDTATVSPGLAGVLSTSGVVEPYPANGLGSFDVSLDMAFTSGESGATAGSVDLETGAESATVTLVDNEFVADLDGFDFGVVFEALGLNELVDLAVDLLEVDELVEELLEDALGDFIDPDELLDEFDINAFIADLDIPGLLSGINLGVLLDAIEFADEPGDHLLELDFEFEFDEPLDLEALDAGLPTQPLAGAEKPPRDLDGAGVFGDVNGDGVVDVLDVQLLFDNMPTINAGGDIDGANAGVTPAQFNFSGASNDRVTVFDVQALFTRAQG